MKSCIGSAFIVVGVGVMAFVVMFSALYLLSEWLYG